jgi:hypothetical protein
VELVVERDEISSTRFEAVRELGSAGCFVGTGEVEARVEEGESGVERPEAMLTMTAMIKIK